MFSVAVLAAGCQDEKYSSSDTGLCHLHFTGTTESYVHDTRTVMDEDMNVVWEQGDQVSIFVGKTLNQRFQVEDDCAGNTDGAFDQVSTPGFVSSTEIHNNVAYYPYSSSISVVPGVHDYAVIATLPSQQTYASNSFGSGAFPMVAVTADRNDTNLKFKNVLGAIKLQIKGTAAICNISLTGNNDENLCGRVSITAGNSSLPSLSFPSEGGKTVTLDCGSGIQLNEATATNFIIALPPTTFTKGFTVIMTDSDGHQMIVSTEKQKVINRSAFLKMAEIIYCGHELHYGHEYVDLGLPSGNLWATANVGANRPEQYGDYFAWGETEPYYEAGYALENPQSHWKSGKSGGYVWSSYRFCNGSYTTMNKYCNDPYYGGGYTDDRTVLDPADDAAHVNWGGDWRMPTVDEFEELIKTDGITRTWYDVGNTEFGGVPGYKFISNISGYEGNWIFLPASGFREGSQLNAGEDLSYWSSSLDLDHPSCGYCLHHYSGLLLCSYISRDYGCPVRPVCPNPNYVKVTSVTLSQSSITMNVGSSATLTAEVYPLNATNKKVTWSSSDPSVATVDMDGTVSAISEGTAVITAETADNVVSSAVISVIYSNLYHRYYMNEFNESDITKVQYFKFENLTQDGITKDAYLPEGKSEQELVITWDEVNEQILAAGIDMSFDEFQKNYNINDIFTLVNTKENEEDPKWEYKPFVAPEGIVLEKPSIPDFMTSTNVLSLKVTNEIYKNHKAPFDTIITLVYKANNNFVNYHVAFNFEIHVTAPETHNHPFKVLGMELNHDYLLGEEGVWMHTPATPEPKAGYSPADDDYTKYAEVRIKGNSDNLNASDLIVHFEDYNFQLDGKCKNSTLSFLIKNYTIDQFVFTNPNEEEDITIEEVVLDPKQPTKKYSKITLTFQQLEKITKGSLLSPKIEYVGGEILFGASRDVLLELEEKCADQYVDQKAASKKAYYYVQFNSIPFNITVDDVVLRTYKDKADYVMVDTLVTITDNMGEELFTFDEESGEWIPTDYAYEEYGIDESIEFTLKIAKDNTFSFPYPNDNQSTFGGHLKAQADENIVEWENGGTDLQNDKHCRLNVVATIASEENTIKTTAEVIVLSTENTNAIVAAEDAAKKAAEEAAAEAAKKAKEEADKKAAEELAKQEAEFKAQYPWVKKSNIGAAKYGYYLDTYVHHDAVEGNWVWNPNVRRYPDRIGNPQYGHWDPAPKDAYDELVKSEWMWWDSIDQTKSNTDEPDHFTEKKPGTLTLLD